ncbi:MULTISPECIES: ExbD/TolR family protein [Winogradskyella]|jgi:biopolymer transport protein ExbD|uniref:ExbD/TolR family protein n=1 Tax=Winogradskyella TaxID=286104 RepID=UPI000C4ABD66|nr:biopolymer transporter ExbD [Winogradskyella sp. MH6]MAB48431.1 biopolymer transporter ExbD [Flavobacteriaceae bacterium]MBD10195.1 biopolymer transporter ExbD [Flavobacteriaceae bacterium]|tara:strand:+ start:1072 stop:1713 length:642 start_codon:yes stop_codon:yes gene_type:complete
MAKRAAPEVNAGSMADIAFLLLIFFLVTTTIEKDKGLLRSLPPIDDTEVEPPIIKQKNLFTVLINRNNQLLVEEKQMELKDLRQAAIEFLDNGGGTNAAGERCDYCKGKRDESSSDHPDKAIISMKHDRETSYEKYIDVQNELVAAYNFLREREAKRLFGNLKEYRGTEKVYQAMLEEKEKNQFSKDTILNGRIEAVKKLFPMKLSEAEPDKS